MPLLLVALWCCIAVANPQDPAPRRGGGGGATAAAAAAAVERAKALQQSDPIAAIEHAAAAAAMLGTGRPRVPAGKAPSAKAMLWAQAQIQLGAAYHTTIRHDEAASAYARALGVLEAAPRGTRDDTGRPLEMEILATKMERGWALSKGLRHSEALAETAALRAYAPPSEADRAHFERTLLLEESRLLLCDGQDAAATVALERGLELNSGGGGGGGGGGGPLDESWSPPADVAAQFSVKMNDLLQLYRWQGREAEAERTARAAMRLGGWPSTTQRPLHTHDHSLSARGSPHAGKPWLTPPAHDQTTERAASASSAVAASAAVALGLGGFLSELEALTSVLRAEYEESLLLLGQRDDGDSGSGGEGGDGSGGYGLMVPQTECLHAPGAGGKGNWLYFPCQGDGGGSSCSHQHTPKACSLLPALAAKHDVVLVRFGYSMLEAGGWIRPHVGPSNAQLKIHLGLKVPPQQQADTTTAAAASAASAHTAAADGNDDADGAAAAADVAGGGGAAGRGSVSAREHCPATFTIAGQMRRWVEGRALLFDDSYEHEVRNGCEESRVVMQLVIAHPAA